MQFRKTTLIISFLVLSLTCFYLGTASVMAQEKVDLNIVPEPKKVNPKMESIISKMFDAFKTDGLAAAQQLAEQRQISLSDGDKIQVVIHSNDLNARGLIEAVPGVVVESVYETLTQALVPLGGLAQIAAMPQIQFIRQPYYPQLLPIVTEGVNLTNADDFHNQNYKGSGIKIAVLDGGFKDYQSLKVAGELPPNLITQDFSGGNFESNEHGAACAEIVYDMAPDAQLYLVAIGTDVEFMNAVNWLINENVDVISASIGWTIGPFDGTSDISQKVNWARDAGIAFAASAGNSAKVHYMGNYADSDLDKLHEFASGDEILTVYDIAGNDIGAGDSILAFLSWDAWPTTDQDYDLYLFGYNGSSWDVLAASENPQTGSQPPIEVIGITVTNPGPYIAFGLAINKWDATGLHTFHLFLGHNTNQMEEGLIVSSSSVVDPGVAEGAITVGAVAVDKYSVANYELEYYSSQGPTDDGRIKPDICAPARVSTVSYGSGAFAGTSASCPHVAGGIPLLMSQDSSLKGNPNQLKTTLMNDHAEDVDASGVDNKSGAGLMMLNAGPPHTVTITIGPNANPNPVDSGQTTQLSVTATDSLGHGIDYSWTVDPLEGNFSDANAKNPTWTAPVNDTGMDKVYTLTATAQCTIDSEVKDTASVQVTVKSESPVNPGDVVINELMWMGSTKSSADEWLELRNMTDSDIDLSGWDITKKSGGIETPMLTIPSGIIPADGYFLISNYDESVSQISVIPDLVDADVSLANNQLQIKLYDGPWETSTLIDIADDGSGAPAAGDSESKYSMVRGSEPGNYTPGDGSLPENWHTADRAFGWDEGATELGTPGYDNALGANIAAFVTLVASPDTLPADGVSESEITVTVEDADGNPVSTETVTMEIATGTVTTTIAQADNGQITSPAINNHDGTYTAIYTAGTTPGIVTVTATTSNEISESVEITLIPICNPGDVSGDGTISAYDAALILQFVVGIIDVFPVEINPSSSGNITPENYSVSVPHLTMNAGNRIQVPINIDDVSGITAGGLVLRYDQNILHAVKVLTSEMLSGYYWQSNIEREGEVRIAFAGTSTSSGHGALFYVEFEALPNNIGKTSPLVLDFAQSSELQSITKTNGSIAILPSSSMLLQSYPNPFNPATWIPYLLAEPSDVIVRIYSKTGQLVRTLSLGHRSAGIYTSQNRAAYWDGKDEHGESVASGVYFYSLQAGKFTETRKMVIVK